MSATGGERRPALCNAAVHGTPKSIIILDMFDEMIQESSRLGRRTKNPVSIYRLLPAFQIVTDGLELSRGHLRKNK